MKPIEFHHDALDVAKWFLQRNALEMAINDAEYITNMKLQKLLYYAQGLCLALTDRPLFDDNIVAWEHGPVVVDVYHAFSSNGARGIEFDEDFRPTDAYSEEEEKILDYTYETFGQFSASKLRNMTHQEPPWRSTQRNKVIPRGVIKAFFLKDYVDEAT